MAAPPSPAHRAMQPFASGFDNDDELPPRKPAMQKQDSKFGRWLSHVHDRLVMRLVCCAPASVVLEVEFEDEDFCRPEDTEIRKIDPHRPSSNKLLKKQKSASVVPVLRGSNRGPSDRDIPTNEELERLPIDLSFVLNDNNDEDSATPATTRRFVPAPPSTPRHVSLMQRAIQIAAFRQQRSARLIQRRWRQAHARSREAAMTDVEDDGDKTDLETDTEQSNNSADRSTKTRRRRIRKHRGRKKKSNN